MSLHPLGRSHRTVLRRAWWWSWRRRIALEVDVRWPAADDVVRVVDLHLSTGDVASRHREARRVIASLAADATPTVIAGDLNEAPGGEVLARFRAAGWTDAWAAVAPVEGGSTNWTPGPRGGRPPDQRLDYVLAPPGWTVVEAQVPATAHAIDWYAERSDHLPLLATLSPA
jgi:endonuclease/exonuclease/phosphatase family metal-dependent hydrolase